MSAKFAEGKLFIFDAFTLPEPKTSLLVNALKSFHSSSFFIVSGDKSEENFALAVKNIQNTVAVPQIGANVYDIISHDYVFLSMEAVSALEQRLK